MESRNILEQVSSWAREGLLVHSLYVYTSPPLILSSHMPFTIEFIKNVFIALATMRCLPLVRITSPKITGVTRVITGDVVASGWTDAHTVDPIGTSKAARLTWITAEEGSCEGVGGHDGKPG